MNAIEELRAPRLELPEESAEGSEKESVEESPDGSPKWSPMEWSEKSPEELSEESPGSYIASTSGRCPQDKAKRTDFLTV